MDEESESEKRVKDSCKGRSRNAADWDGGRRKEEGGRRKEEGGVKVSRQKKKEEKEKKEEKALCAFGRKTMTRLTDRQTTRPRV